MGRLVLALALAMAALSETDKIEALIKTVESMKDARFIRNGSEYTCVDAAKHMRRKWHWQTSSIKTARDFIRVAASTSSQSGQPYLIRWKDGREMTAADFLNAELDKLEGKRKK